MAMMYMTRAERWFTKSGIIWVYFTPLKDMAVIPVITRAILSMIPYLKMMSIIHAWKQIHVATRIISIII